MNDFLVVFVALFNAALGRACATSACPSCMHTWANTSMDDYAESTGGRLTVKSADECSAECMKNTYTCHMWTYAPSMGSPNCFLDGRGNLASDGRYYIGMRNESGSTAGLLVDLLPYVGKEPPGPAPPSARYIGCFPDLVDGGARDLPWFWCSNGTSSTPMSGVNFCSGDPRIPEGTGASSWAAAAKMSPALCSKICTYFRYYGVQDGNKCFCGDQFGYYGNATEDKCNSKCTDPTAEGLSCGGVLHNSVYESAPPPTTSPSSLAFRRKAPPIPLGIEYVGCFKDQLSPLAINALPVFFCPMGLQYCPGETPVVDGIAMACVEPESGTPPQCSGLFDADACARFNGPTAGTIPQMSIKVCEAACTGFKYFGLNNGDRCYCGSDVVISPTAFANATEDKCSAPCTGNNAEKCGGKAIDSSGRFTSVYRRKDELVDSGVQRRARTNTHTVPSPKVASAALPNLQHGVTGRKGLALRTERIKQRRRLNPRDDKVVLRSVENGIPRGVPICRSHPCKNPPAELDWEKKGGVVTPVKDQGASCNAAWAFAAVAAVESASALATGRLVDLSEQELLDCGWNFGLQSCRGGSVNRAFRYIAQIGLSTENSYMYSGTANRCCGSSQGYTGVPSQEGQGMQAFCDLNPMNESELVGAMQFQPVAVGLAVDEEFMNYEGGILNSSVGSRDGRPLNHAALVVGYTPTYWRIKNSFGAQWGEGGYARLARNVGGAGQYGILTSPSYPSVISPSIKYPKPVEPHKYDKPPCKDGEVELAVAGLPGKICTSPCSTSQPCPTNQGKGADAQVQCALEDPRTKQKYCALLCQTDCDCAQAPFALTCQTSPYLPFRGWGLCAAPVS